MVAKKEKPAVQKIKRTRRILSVFAEGDGTFALRSYPSRAMTTGIKPDLSNEKFGEVIRKAISEETKK